MKYVLYMHYGSNNHGCEAIVKTTSELLGDYRNNLLWSMKKSEDIKNGVAPFFSDIYSSEELKKYSASYFEALIQRTVLHKKNANMNIFLRDLFRNNVAVCVGGDNYCYPYSANQAVELNKTIRKYARATILWGCSVEEKALTPEVIKDLGEYNLITARESITYELLRKINPNTVKVSDPAFILKAENAELPGDQSGKDTVGINVSPLILKYVQEGSLILENYKRLIEYIIQNTDMNVCLIPHVVWKGNNDLEPIKWLFDQINEPTRISIASNGTANQLKGYISNCRFFIGARTHSTIAAYSTGVPTLVVGYSVKSTGIARDLFGTDENYVLPVQSLSTEDELTEKFKWLVNNESRIRDHLKMILPGYIDNAYAASKAVEELMNKIV